ncbi:MAG TPA: glycosyltransferase N-terminal domain-containing protein [Chitinophagales bacterium]|nr:glycosyltransferase N-terminal domain-containing protein [Chitinophagales bacterium]
MHFLSLLVYNIAIFCYGLGIFIASIFTRKSYAWISGRKYWRCRLMEVDFKPGKRIWFHCASLGEFEQARPLIEKWRSTRPDDVIILTFFSPSGFEIRQNYAHADLVTYLPLDTPRNARDFIARIKPDIAFFVKYEFWYNHITRLKELNVPVILFSAVFRPGQVFFKWYGGMFRKLLGNYAAIFVQNEESKTLLQGIGISSTMAPDTRFDRVYHVAQNHKQFPAIEKFKGSSKILIAGSTWQHDEDLLLKCIEENILPGYKYIIAPHNIKHTRIEQLVSSIKVRAHKFSDLTEANAAETDVVVINNIGNLSSLYAYGDIAYIGGGFNASVHNVLEAAVYKIPVLFGPNFQKSEEAKDLIALGMGFCVTDYPNLQKNIRYAASHLVTDELNKVKLEKYIVSHLGGTEQIFKAAQPFLR